MSLSILSGPPGSGKTAYILGELKKTIPLRAGILVLPSKSQADEICRHLLMAANSPGLIGDVVLSWPRFTSLLANSARPILSLVQSALLINHLFTNHPLQYFRMKHPSMGLSIQFAETIIALKKGTVGHEHLRHILTTRGSLKENDLLTIFERYVHELKKRRLCDEGDVVMQALENIEGERALILSNIRFLAFCGFHRFDPGQLAIISALKKSMECGKIFITIPEAENADSLHTDYLTNFFKKLVPLADKVIKFHKQRAMPPAIAVHSVRSPAQEARLHAHMMATSISNGYNEVALIHPGENHFLDIFLNEAACVNIVEPSSIGFACIDAPIIHEILAPSSTMGWPEEANVGEYVNRCKELLHSKAKISNWLEQIANRSPQYKGAARSLASIAGLEELLQNLSTTATLLNMSSVRREVFIKFLISELSVKKSSHAEHFSLFRMASFDSGIALPVDEVFIPKMVEGIIPRRSLEKLFFTEADRLAHKPDRTIDDIFPSSEETLAIESSIFASLMAKCRKQAVITYPLIDDGGTQIAPSSFLDDLPQATPHSVLLSPTIIANDRYQKERLNLLIRIENMRRCGLGEYPEYRGTITSPSALFLINKRFTDHPFSATSLEVYAECPFVFFAKKVLNLEPLEEETPELLPKDRGTIIHALLERFYKHHLKEFKKVINKPSEEKKLHKILDEELDIVLNEHAHLIGKSSVALAPIGGRVIRQLVLQSIEFELCEARKLRSPLFPIAHEWSFGNLTSDTLAIPIDGAAPALIRGRIDRVDTDESQSKFLIIDYKTGSNVQSVKNEILEGRHLQLPIYVEAVRQFLMPHAMPLGGLLFSIVDAEKKHGFIKKEFNDVHYSVGRAHSALDEITWETMISNALLAAASHVSAIRKGKFSTDGRSSCRRHCDYAKACRYKSVGPD